jgi:serine/threonine protein kinase
VSWLSDAVLAHLCGVADAPDVGGTRYELVEAIGRGGMGIVYLARDRQLDRPVALKVVDVGPDGARARGRLAQEARIIARLEHPGIVPVHDSGVLPDGRLYYAMKLVRGRRLDEPGCRSAALAERLRVFLKVCDTVAFAHAHGVIHRDLKPQNIMLGSFGEVLVMDWGVAREVGTVQQPPAGSVDVRQVPSLQTAHGTVLGTPGYMAPEQARGDVGAIDERTDVYGLGGVLYFLLTGCAPVHEERRDAAPAPVLRPPRWYDRSIPRPLEAVCLKALAGDPASRYGSVPQLAGDVASFLAGHRVGAYAEGFLGTARRLGMRYRTVLSLIVAYLVMRILLLIFGRT